MVDINTEVKNRLSQNRALRYIVIGSVCLMAIIILVFIGFILNTLLYVVIGIVVVALLGVVGFSVYNLVNKKKKN